MASLEDMLKVLGGIRIIYPRNFLAQAVRKDPCKCPAALAMMDALKDVPGPNDSKLIKVEMLGNRTRYTFDNGKELEYMNSKRITNAIKHYDETGEWPDEAEAIRLFSSGLDQDVDDPRLSSLMDYHRG